MRGGVCADAVCSKTKEVEIQYINLLNPETLKMKQSFRQFSFADGMALDWTSDSRTAGALSYVQNGKGESYENNSPFEQVQIVCCCGFCSHPLIDAGLGLVEIPRLCGREARRLV